MLALVWLLAAVPAHSQQEDYAERFAALARAYAQEPTSVENLYNLAQFYFDNSHPMRNLPKAMQYILQAESRHIDLLKENEHSTLTKLLRQGITINTIRQTEEAIYEAAYGTVKHRTSMTNDEIDAYLDAFGDDAVMVRLLRQHRIDLAYREDLQRGTPQSYYHFIETYNGTNEADRMEEQLSRVAADLYARCRTVAEVDSVAAHYPLSLSVKRAAAKQRSRLAFAEACRTNTVAAFKQYLKQYPSSDEYVEASERLDALVEREYHTLRTVRQYADFADSNADNALADKALEQVRRMALEQRDMEAMRLYLQRFKSDPRYNEVYAHYYAWHAAEGNSGPIQRFIDENPDYPFMQTAGSDLQRAEDIDRIALMEDFHEARYPLYANHIRQLMGRKIAFVPLQRTLQALLASHNYRAALERVQEFDICFETESQTEYAELQRILSTPHPERRTTTQFEATYNILNPNVNAADGHLYFTYDNGAVRKIGYAVKADGKWQYAGDVAFSNAENRGLTLFGFYAGGNRMLIGYDGDIWLAKRDDAGWRISDIPPYPVNTDYVETDAYMLPDGSGLLLASDRPGGQNLQVSGSYFHGDTALATDLYFIPFTQNGWGEAVNLGLGINTPYSERSPLLSRNLKTLYFITDGRGGLGYGDIYTATRTDPGDWTRWSTPVNAGRETNTGFNEASVSFGPDEKTLFISATSNAGLYACRSVAAWHNSASAAVTRRIHLGTTAPTLSRLRLADMAQQSVVQTVTDFDDSLTVDFNIQADRRYALLADAGSRFVPAIVLVSGDRSAPTLKGYTPALLMALDKALPLPVVEYDGRTAVLTPLGRMQLAQLAQFLGQQKDMSLEIIVDVAGNDDAQAFHLSLERARAVQSYLSDNGIAAGRISLSPFGNVHCKRGTAEGVSIRFRE